MRKRQARPRANALRAFFLLPGSRSFAISLVLFVVVAAIATVEIATRYRSGETDLSFVQALYAALNLLLFNAAYALPDDALSRIVFFLFPLLGLVVVGQLMIRLGTALLKREQWERAMASTYTDHAIVCGLGRVGYRVTRWLRDLGEPIVVVEYDEKNTFLDEVRSWGVPVIVADARRGDILRQAGIAKASTVAALTSDDLLNLSVATEARSLRPGIRVVLRTFEDRLAENLRKGFDIYAAYSASSLAAPAFAAAATRAPVDHALALGHGEESTLITVTSFTIVETSRLAGETIGNIEREFGVNVLAHRRQRFEFHPPNEVVLEAGDEIAVAAPLEVLDKLSALTPPTRFLARYEAAHGPVSD